MWKLLNILPRIQSSFFIHFTWNSLNQVYSGFASTVTIRVLTLSASFSYWLLHQLTQDVSVKLPDYVISISADMCFFIITCLWADFHRRRRKDGGRVTAWNHWVFFNESRGRFFNCLCVIKPRTRSFPNPNHDVVVPKPNQAFTQWFVATQNVKLKCKDAHRPQMMLIVEMFIWYSMYGQVLHLKVHYVVLDKTFN